MARKLSTSLRRSLLIGTSALGLQLLASADLLAQANAPTAAAALKLMPTQKADVEVDTPSGAEAENCKIEARADRSGWVVRAANGQILREFVDTNKNQVVDRWCYYKDGVEVYRDIDENHDGRAEQCRWMNTAGIRWGLDTNQDGTIDSWKLISPEEVTAEVVAAMRTRDAARFQRVLLTETEMAGLGLGEERAAALKTKLAKAPASFANLLKAQGDGFPHGRVTAGIEPETRFLRRVHHRLEVADDLDVFAEGDHADLNGKTGHGVARHLLVELADGALQLLNGAAGHAR